MSSKKSILKKTQVQRAEETRQLILMSACKIFGEKGYENTYLEEIVAETALTISPIYHHFGNKLQLFSAVNDYMEEQLLEWLDNFAKQGEELSLQQGWDDFITLCKRPGFAQIVLIDAPHVLGRDRWKISRVVAKANDILLSKGLGFPTVDDNSQSAKDKELIMRMVMAALAEAALMIGQDPEYNSKALINSLFSLFKR